MVGIAILVLVGVAVLAASLPSHRKDRPSELSSASLTKRMVRRHGRLAGQPEPDRQVTMPTTSELGRRLRALSDEGVLSAEQAADLWQAAQQDGGMGGDAADATGAWRETQNHRGASTSSLSVLDVLGYVGGALLLGASIFVGFTLWGDLSRGAKTALAITSFAAPVAGGAVLEWSRTRRGLARVLLALGCFAAGFACSVIIDDQDLMISAGVVVVAAVIGLITLRSVAFYLPGWVGAMAFVPAFVQNGLDVPEGDAFGYWMAGGFLLVGLAHVVAGIFLGRQVAWTLAGLSGWVATIPLVSFDHSYLALAVATLVAGSLFVGVVRLKTYTFAIVGCLIVLTIWPVALYQILDTALGVALGLVAAGCVLIASAVVLARWRNRAASTGSGSPA
jgi:hypothetical protein